jgi:hypothetical protein
MKTPILIFFGWLLLTSYSWGATSELVQKQLNIQSLSDLKWKARVVVTSVQSKSELTQIKAFYTSHLVEFQERRLLVVVFLDRVFLDSVFPDSIFQDSVCQNNKVSTFPSTYVFGSQFCTELLKISNKNQTFLLGLDGGVKHRYSLLNWTEVFQHIDSMPMRRAQMKNRN